MTSTAQRCRAVTVGVALPSVVLIRAVLIRAVLLSVVLLGLAACTGGTPEPGSATSTGPLSSSTTATAGPAPASPTISDIPEPTTTNTLPPPPVETAPAPSTAGRLTAASLPVPAGWRTVVREGGSEEGYEGNGTWTHGRDPRYAAQDVVALGCMSITRDDYDDPRAALEGTYEGPGAQPGVGLVLDFSSPTKAEHFFSLFRRQVESCQGRAQPYGTELVPATGGLIDRRTYPDSEWTEIVRAHGNRVTFIILSDPGHRIEVSAAQRILDQIG